MSYVNSRRSVAWSALSGARLSWIQFRYSES